MLTWETKGESVHEFYDELRVRPVQQKPDCAVKSLITSLRLLQQGPYENLEKSYEYISIVDAIGGCWALKMMMYDGSQPMSAEMLRTQLLIARLSAMIIQKLHFHRVYPYLDARFQSSEVEEEDRHSQQPLEAFSKQHYKQSIPKRDLDEDVWETDVQMASRLLTMLGTIEGVVRMALGMQDPFTTSISPHVSPILTSIQGVSKGLPGLQLDSSPPLSPKESGIASVYDQYIRGMYFDVVWCWE